MTKNTVMNRFLVFFLLLSFFLISMAVLPVFFDMDSTNSISFSQSEQADSSPSLSLVIHNCLDYLDTENVSFQLGLSQNFEFRKQITDKDISLLSAFPTAYSDFLFCDFSSDELCGQSTPSKIIKFLHTKDGMI